MSDLSIIITSICLVLDLGELESDEVNTKKVGDRDKR